MTTTNQSGSPMIDDLVKEAYDILVDGEVTFGEIVRLGGSLAGKANHFAPLSGHQKQALVIRVVEAALEKVLKEKTNSLPEDQRAAFVEKIHLAAQFAKDTLPSVLDVAVAAARGKLGLSTVVNKKTCWMTIKLLLRCAGVQVPALPSPVMNFLEGPKEVSASSVELVAKSTVMTVVKKTETVVQKTVHEVVEQMEKKVGTVQDLVEGAVQVATETILPLAESAPKSEESSEPASA
jgi:hypothetical protein